MQGGSGGTPPENFEVLHALKRVLGASEAPFCACIQYIHIPASCRLRLAVSDQNGALANAAQFLRRIKCAVKFASEQHKREAG